MKRAYVISLALTGCIVPAVHGQAVDSLYWSDGDSGRINGVDFRLADVDAPETGGVGARGGAKCEPERALGYIAKQSMSEATRGKKVVITNVEEKDDFGRVVMSLSIDGRDAGELGVASGYLKPYVFDGKRATMPKPDWCK